MSAEGTVVRNYIDWLISIPWFDRSKLQLDIDKAEAILEEDHYGLEKPKERILEYLAVQKLVKKIRGPDPLSCRPSWCWKDILGQICCPVHKARVHPPVPWRCQRRGRNPGPSADLYWCHAREDHSVPEESEGTKTRCFVSMKWTK